MNILMLTSSLAEGGAETHICSLAVSLAKRGHRVCVISSGGRLSEGLAWHGVKHIKMPLGSKNPILMMRSALRLRALIKIEKYHIIHIHSRLAGLICRMALWGRGECVVSTVHSHFKTDFLLRRLSFWGDISIAVSEDLRDYLSENYGVCSDNIALIPNGIDTHKFSPRATKSSDSVPRIVFVSRMDTDCYLCASLLCKIAPRLAKNFDSVKIELIGGGSAYHKVLHQAEAANREIGYDCVSATGFTRNVADKLRSADIFVGVSRAALEAMACAVPTVLAGNEGFIGLLDSSNLPRAAQTNFCCRGNEMPTSEALFSDICTLLEMSDEQRLTLGEYLRKYVCKNHSIEKLAEQTEQFYDRARARVLSRPADTLLCGYYGFSNLGDDASLAAAIERCRAEGSDACVICKNKKRTARVFGVRCVSRLDPFAVIKELRGCRRLVLGGGSILQNVTSNRSLLFYSSLILLAKRLGARVELWANGIGPLKSRFARLVASRALRACDRIGLRDEFSVQLAWELGAKSKAIVSEEDLASATVEADESRIEYIKKKLDISDKKFALIGINGNTDRKLTKKMAKKIVGLSSKQGITPVFVVMQKGADLKVSKRLARKCNGLVCNGLTARELRGLIRTARFALGTRYHLLYFAKLASVPIYPFGDDPKMLSLL